MKSRPTHSHTSCNVDSGEDRQNEEEENSKKAKHFPKLSTSCSNCADILMYIRNQTRLAWAVGRECAAVDVGASSSRHHMLHLFLLWCPCFHLRWAAAKCGCTNWCAASSRVCRGAYMRVCIVGSFHECTLMFILVECRHVNGFH